MANVARLLHKPSVIWAFLITLTLISVAVCEGRLLGSLSTLLIIAIAAIKSRMVILHYMEARRAPKIWRTLYETWNFTAAAIIAVGHYVTVWA